MTKISKKFIEAIKILGYHVTEETEYYFILDINEYDSYMFTRHSNANLYIGIPLMFSASNNADPANSSILTEFVKKLKHFFKDAYYKGSTLYIDAEDTLWH